METDPALKRIHPRERKIYIHTKTCPGMFMALFIIAKRWKQSKCPSTGEWKSMWYIQAMECSSVKDQNTCYDINEPQNTMLSK